MREIGLIKRLQIQTANLKQGDRANRVYSPAAILPVPALQLTPEGVVGLLADGATQLDAHHAHHPLGKNRQVNGISFNFFSHYGRMQQQFGDHVVIGCAGENILVETEEVITPEQAAAGVVILAQDNQHIPLTQAIVALPCDPFSRYVLNQEERPLPTLLKQTLQFLDKGTRGFYATFAGSSAVVRLGDRLCLAA